LFDYRNYFKQIKPKNEDEIFQRFLFAFLSVHTSWKNNVSAFQKLKKCRYWKKEEIGEGLKESGAGMHNMRTEYISAFRDSYNRNPKEYLKKQKEGWKPYRDRTAKSVKGLGISKSSFAIELVYPLSAWITCVDIHMARYCGLDQSSLTPNIYYAAEEKIIKEAKNQKLLPSEFRWKYWDNLQGQKNPRYWSYCLED